MGLYIIVNQDFGRLVRPKKCSHVSTNRPGQKIFTTNLPNCIVECVLEEEKEKENVELWTVPGENLMG